jgi:hypothetical protein
VFEPYNRHAVLQLELHFRYMQDIDYNYPVRVRLERLLPQDLSEKKYKEEADRGENTSFSFVTPLNAKDHIKILLPDKF